MCSCHPPPKLSQLPDPGVADTRMRYSRLLEENSFSNRRADYVWLLVLTMAFLLALSPLITMPFLSSSLAFALVYIWSRRNPAVKMSLFGVVT